MNWSKDNQLKSNIAYILHQADMMASKIEYDQWQRGDYDYPYNTEFGEGKTKEEMEKIDIANRDREQKIDKEKTKQSKAANQAFKELFGE